MDISELITLGKIEKQVKYGSVTFHLTTPSSEDVENAKDNVDLVAAFVNKVGDKSIASKEDREELKKTLKAMQSAVVGNLAQKCTDLIKEQNDLIEGLSKK